MTQRNGHQSTLHDICLMYHELYDQSSLMSASSQDEQEEIQPHVVNYLQSVWIWIMSRFYSH
jgi:hypothetical protein